MRRGGDGRWRAVRRLLRSAYAEVLPLEAFVQRLHGRAVDGAPPEPLVQDWDPASYRQLVGRCLVARVAEGDDGELPARVAFHKASSQKNVIAKVIQRICEKKEKNVLASGYDLMNEKAYRPPCMPNIYNYMPNNTTENICHYIPWEVILSRVGDDVMMYIFEHCTLFMLVPPSCCYQICGQPLYKLSFKNATHTSAFFTSKYPGPTHNVLSGYLRRRYKSWGQFLSRANWKKWNSRRQKSSETQKVLHHDYPLHSRIGRLNPAITKPITRISRCIESEQRSSQCTSTPSLLKRKWMGQWEIRAKRGRREEALEKETNLVPTQSKKLYMLDNAGDSGTSKGCGRLSSEDGLIVPLGTEFRAEMSDIPCVIPDNPEGFVCDKIQNLDSKNETLYELNSRRESSTRQPALEMGISNVCSVPSLAREIANVGSNFETHTSKSVWNSGSISVPLMHIKSISERKWNKTEQQKTHWHIKRRSILYSDRQLKERLPKSFVLNHLKSSLSGGRQLVEEIFLRSKILKQTDSMSHPGFMKGKKRLPKRYWQMRGLFQELLEKHTKCPYLKVLRKNCPVQVSGSVQNGTKGESDKEKDYHERTRSSRSWQDSTLENCLRPVPSGLNSFLGISDDATRTSESVELKGKDAEKQISQDSSKSGITVLLKQHSNHWQVYMFVRECLDRVVPVALWGSNHNKCRFYKNVKKFISQGKFAVFSLQELMWKMRVNSCTWLHLNKERKHFVPASEHRFRQDLMAKFLYWLMDSYVGELIRSFFYVTETMFRKNLLFFFRKSIWSKIESVGIRNHLAKVHLRVLLKKEIEALQKQKYVPLSSKLRFIPKPNGLRPVAKLKSVIGAETDCRKSGGGKFNSFNTRLKMLFSVLNYERMKNPNLLGSTVFGRDDIYAAWKKFVLRVLELNVALPEFYFVKVSTYQEFLPDMEQFIDHLQENASLRNAVVVEQYVSKNESNSSLYKFFLQFIRNNILKIMDRYYVQCCGIPQGSILSNLLCNYCYGDMENMLLQDVQKDGLLMRLTDDFLLVTPHLTHAKMFLRTLAAGIPEYGFVINPAKTVVNFPVDEDIQGCSEFKQLPAHCVMPWCGLLIDTQTLEVYCDYSSYACTSIRSSLSFNSSTKAGVSMRNKLLEVLKLKYHSLFIDLQINSLRTVGINIYKILLLQAFRFHACVLQLPFNQKIKSNPSFYLKIISDTAACCFSILKTKNSDISFAFTGTSVVLTYTVVQWLSYHAFVVKLAKHKVIYKCLLDPLKHCKIQLLRQFPETTVQFLKDVTKPSLHEDFKFILD